MKANEFIRRIEIRDKSGRVVVSFEELNEDLEESVAAVPKTESAANHRPAPSQASTPTAEAGAPSNGAPPMTEAQRRYLFRILAGRGIQGDEAHERLKMLFEVDSLDVVTKTEATKAIDRLLADGNAEASPHGASQR